MHGGAVGRTFHLRPSLRAGLFPPCLSLLELQAPAQEVSCSPWPSLANFYSQMLQAAGTSPGLLLLRPHPSCVIPPNPPAGLQSILALAQTIGSSLPGQSQSLSETHCETYSFRKPSWIHTIPYFSPCHLPCSEEFMANAFSFQLCSKHFQKPADITNDNK